jgi:hypothetical protein
MPASVVYRIGEEPGHSVSRLFADPANGPL